jgi:hypothetical protein
MMKKLLLAVLAVCGMAMGVKAQYVKKSDLPAVYLETFDGNGIYSKDVYEYCRLHYVDEEGTVTHYDSVSIRGRGNSTWNMSKKPYRIKFLNKEKFLGKGYAKAKKWTLLANAGDKTMIRNAVTSAMGEFCAELREEGADKSLPFNPAAKFVDLSLNGAYQGTYQISDLIDVRAHRVNIVEQNVPLGTDDDITGGYLLEVDGFRDGNWFATGTYNSPVRIHYPDDEEIVERQTTYIKNHVNKFEKALASNDFADPEKGYRAYVDSASLIDWYICTEVSANIDGFYSTYFYKERGDDRLFWGPLWDYDIAYNNDERVKSEQHLNSSVNALMVNIAYSGSREWVRRMWEDPWFQKNVYVRYKQLLDAGLVDYMQQKVDSLQALLSESQALNYAKWGINKKMYHEMVLYSTYDQYVSDLKTFITEHCAYLESAFADRKPTEPTPPFVPDDFFYHIVNAKTMKSIDVSGSSVMQNATDNNRASEDWYMRDIGDGKFLILNRSNNLALNDPTPGSATATTNVGTQLNVVEANEEDTRQQWQFLPQGTAGYYNLLNVYTQHIANLSGGSSDNGTSILSYTNDSRNGESLNRLWYIVDNGGLPDELTGIEAAVPDEYALAYNPVFQILHFGSSQPESLTFTVHVVALNGMPVGSFVANEQFSMADQPSGIYIVSWKVNGKTRSVKFRK